MNKPNVEGAIAYALTRLAAELPADMVYHSLAHTRDEVLPAAARLGQLAGLGEHDLDLLRVAAAFHDLGYAETQEEHELCSIRIAAQVLPAFGFPSRAIEQVIGMIVATRMPQAPRNLLEELLADADLDGLGREDALQRSVDLLGERRAYGSAIGDEEWWREQIDFLSQHRYWTTYGESLRGEGKARTSRPSWRWRRKGAGPTLSPGRRLRSVGESERPQDKIVERLGLLKHRRVGRVRGDEGQAVWRGPWTAMMTCPTSCPGMSSSRSAGSPPSVTPDAWSIL